MPEVYRGRKSRGRKSRGRESSRKSPRKSPRRYFKCRKSPRKSPRYSRGSDRFRGVTYRSNGDLFEELPDLPNLPSVYDLPDSGFELKETINNLLRVDDSGFEQVPTINTGEEKEEEEGHNESKWTKKESDSLVQIADAQNLKPGDYKWPGIHNMFKARNPWSKRSKDAITKQYKRLKRLRDINPPNPLTF